VFESGPEIRHDLSVAGLLGCGILFAQKPPKVEPIVVIHRHGGPSSLSRTVWKQCLYRLTRLPGWTNRQRSPDAWAKSRRRITSLFGPAFVELTTARQRRGGHRWKQSVRQQFRLATKTPSHHAKGNADPLRPASHSPSGEGAIHRVGTASVPMYLLHAWSTGMTSWLDRFLQDDTSSHREAG
jgi:hypothetical protein